MAMDTIYDLLDGLMRGTIYCLVRDDTKKAVKGWPCGRWLKARVDSFTIHMDPHPGRIEGSAWLLIPDQEYRTCRTFHDLWTSGWTNEETYFRCLESGTVSPLYTRARPVRSSKRPASRK